MKILTIKLKKKDKRSIKYVLEHISTLIEEGFHSGIEFPVTWWVKSKKSTNNDLQSIQNVIAELRDSNNHVCEADENDNALCSCHKYDSVIDTLENMKFN